MTYTPQGTLMRDSCTHQLDLAHIAIGEGARLIDLSKIERVDSTALAYWLALQRWSAERDIELEWSGLPDQMLSIAELVGIDELIAR